MITIIVVCVIVYILFKVFRSVSNSSSSNNNGRYSSSSGSGRSYQSMYEDNKSFSDEKPLLDYIEREEMKGSQRFRLKGTSFYNLKRSDVGIFNGSAVAEENNQYDEYAIAIYKEGKKIGHLPTGNKEMHEYIMNHGGTVNATGYINGNHDCFWSEVCVEFNETEWAESIPVEERIYASANLRKHDMEDINQSVPYGKFEGVARTIEGRMFPIEIYNKDGQKVGAVKGNMNLYYTLKFKENGEVEAWGLLKRDYSYVYIPVMCGSKRIANAKARFIEEVSNL